MKFNAYIDGFNLYKGALQKNPEFKWLDLRAFCQSRWAGHELQKVYFFTSRIKEKFPGDDAPRRQHLYLRALRNTDVEIVLGKFRKDIVWNRLNSPVHANSIYPALHDPLSLIQDSFNISARDAAPDSIKAHVWKYGEKGTDVNLASYFLRDVFQFELKAALVITGDSDLVTPLEMAHNQFVTIKTINPKSGRNSGKLSEVSDYFEELDRDSLVNFQLREKVFTENRKWISRPSVWRKKEDPNEFGSSA